MTTFQHWMFSVRLMRLADTNVDFIRIADRAGRETLLGDGGYKSYGDFDFGGSLSKHLKRDVSTKSELFVRQLGYGFPVAPLGPRTAVKILSFEYFPSYDEWTKRLGEEAYSEEQYRYDSNLWWRQKITIKSFEGLYRWILRTRKSIARKQSPRDRGPYARQVLSVTEETLGRLRLFYPMERWLAVPSQVEDTLKMLRGISYSCPPEQGRGKGKKNDSPQPSGPPPIGDFFRP